jgi:hypothetical protein
MFISENSPKNPGNREGTKNLDALAVNTESRELIPPFQHNLQKLEGVTIEKKIP